MGLRLAARITGTIWATVIIFIFVGTVLEGMHKNSGLPSKPHDIFGIAAVISLGIAVAGLVIGWWKESIGGFSSFLGFIAAGVFLIISPKLNFSLLFLIIALIPAILYLAYWLGVRKSVS